nr:MAG TPA: YopX protein [Caudoviricetes sp.]
MNERYLFKAKRIDNGEWVQGYLYGIWEKRYILWGMTNDIPNMIEVDPTTICQCTGLKDKDGKLIWENDIVKNEKGNFYKAFWQNNYYQFSWICVKADVLPIGTKWNLWSIKSFEIEVIGNIFDNPDFLERE